MDEKKEEVTVLDKNDNVMDSKKIDLYINNNDQDLEQGISIINIFTYMKKRFHIFIFIILMTFIIGLLVPMVIYSMKDKNENAIAILGLDYDGADSGLAPDGASLDISYLKSSYIIQNALSDVKLSKSVSVALVQSNLTITGVLTDDTKEKLEILKTLEENKSNEYAKLIQNFSLKYRAQYIITLKNGFKDGNKKVTLPSDELAHLLSAITNSYSEYFNDIYQDNSLPNDYISAIDEDSLDLLDILDEIQVSLDYLENFCKVRATYVPGFRTSDGLSFSDLASTINTIKSSDIDYIYSFIYLNRISRYSNVQLTKYKYQLREAELKISEVEASIITLKNSIDNYKSDEIVISSVDNNNQPIKVQVNSDYYNELVFRLTELNEEKTTLQRKISILNSKKEKLEGAPASQDKVDKAEEYVAVALSNANEIYNIVYNHSNELYSSNAYKNQYMHSITTTESDSIKSSLKLFAIGAVAGLFIGVAAGGVDALVLEFKNSKKEQEGGLE